MKTLEQKIEKFIKKLFKVDDVESVELAQAFHGSLEFVVVRTCNTHIFFLQASDFEKYKIKELVQLVRTNTFQSI